ncbi:MAG: hypothetical protein N4A63_06860 [Vallitalea sp.]|nr:hypothetical protein [Vallitalea sp.]
MGKSDDNSQGSTYKPLISSYKLNENKKITNADVKLFINLI